MSTTRLKLIHDGDRLVPFFRKEGCTFGHYICLNRLNHQFSPRIPHNTPCIYICTSPRPLPSKADSDFWLMGHFPYVETSDNAGNYLHYDIKHYLKTRYEAGDRVAWIEYEEAE